MSGVLSWLPCEQVELKSDMPSEKWCKPGLRIIDLRGRRREPPASNPYLPLVQGHPCPDNSYMLPGHVCVSAMGIREAPQRK